MKDSHLFTVPKQQDNDTGSLNPIPQQIMNKDLTMKGKSDLQSSSKVPEEEEGDYEIVNSSTLEAIHALRILPAKPLQESEYAGSTLNVENSSVRRSPSPTPYTAHRDKSKHSLVKREMQSLAQPTEKDLNKYEWYIGEYDRHEAEKALLQENIKFNSVKEIIDFYKRVPITLIDGKDKSGIQREQCYLTYPFKSHKRCFLP
ncbi:cytokine-dependent hematopoietic cell linker [Limosa lapponica baueri]|uniref:Cytokine-dependent hematopoietic cell linker n=1 Tax=Limosa lapponica baueri TaxID=1758121 RepID=A0A2I0UGJ8_LIMLA|nr:cytokine-dependent hematopoietic cell linker [Limosa lapponica baueri]